MAVNEHSRQEILLACLKLPQRPFVLMLHTVCHFGNLPNILCFPKGSFFATTCYKLSVYFYY